MVAVGELGCALTECASESLVRPPTDHVYYGLTKSLCAHCKGPVDAKVVFRGGAVHLDKFCPAHGHQRAVVSSSAEWFIDCLSFLSPSTPPALVRQPVMAGCPYDCGPCELHQQTTEVRSDALPARVVSLAELRSRGGDLIDEWLRGAELVLEVRTDSRSTTPDAQRLLAAALPAGLTSRDFVPSPRAHPLCYSVCVVAHGVDGGGAASLVPATRHLSRAEIFARLAASLYLRDEAPWWPAAGRMRAFYIHDLMDAERFDVARVMRCPVSAAGEDEIPLCASEILYEDPEERGRTLARRAPRSGLSTRPLPVFGGST